MSKKYLFFIAALVFFVSILTSCKKEKDLSNGYIEADFVYISAYSNGKIENVYVSKGDQVKKGTKLFKLEGKKEYANFDMYTQAANGVNFYIKDMKKGARPDKLKLWTNIAEAIKFIAEGTGIGDNMYTSLEKDRAVSYKDQQKITHIHKAALKMSQGLRAWAEFQELSQRPDKIAAVESLKKILDTQSNYSKWEMEQVTQTAPKDAFVFDTFFREGEFAQAGKPVISLLPPENIKAVFFVDGKVVNKVKLGNKVLINLSNVIKPIEATVSYISPNAEYTDPFIYSLKNNKKYMYLIEARFNSSDNVKLHPGQPIEVDISI